MARGVPRTFQNAYAAGKDAGAASARKAGRTRWSREDYNRAVRAFNKVLPKDR